jgi:ZIP family zinc transporter
LIGTVAGAFWRPPQRLVAIALAFASGVLITALAFDLFEETFKAGGPWIAGGGFLV